MAYLSILVLYIFLCQNTFFIKYISCGNSKKRGSALTCLGKHTGCYLKPCFDNIGYYNCPI